MRIIGAIAGVCFCAFALAQSGDHPFRDCAECPEMVVVPAGSFMMGSPVGQGFERERPQHLVTFSRPFAVGKYEVTFAEWDACVAAGGCGRYRPNDLGWGRGRRPVIHVSWDDAQAYVSWLSARTGYCYRLLSESEWEYAARAGTTTEYSFGATILTHQANFGPHHARTVPVGSFAANGFGLHDMHGNVQEWTADCENEDYVGAPADGSAWESGNCGSRTVRGGSWPFPLLNSRSAHRAWIGGTHRGNFDIGFRVARAL